LRQLKDIAYEGELDQELSELYQDFQKWRNDEIGCSGASEKRRNSGAYI
jgi:hypothetical protein